MPYDVEDKKELRNYEEELRKEWNRGVIAHIRKVSAIKKPSPHFPDTIEEACKEYFDLCQDDGIKPSVAGLSVALGVNEEILLQWVRGEVSIVSADVIKRYFSFIQVFDETALKDNQTNAVGSIFMGKQHYGYKDVVEHKIVDEREKSNEEIEAIWRKRIATINQNPKEIEIVEAKVEKPIEAKVNTKPSKAKKEETLKVVDDEVPF